MKSKGFNSNIWTYVFSFAASAVGILLNFFLARLLQAESYGRIQYLIALSTTISQFLIFGLNSYLIRESKNAEQKGEVFNKSFSLFMCLLLIVLPIVFLFLSRDDSLNLFTTIIVIVVGVLIAINSLISAYYQGNGKYRFTVIIENFIPKFALLNLTVIFYLLNKLSILEENYLLFYIGIYLLIAIPLIVKHFRHFNLKFKFSELKTITFFFGVTITYSLGNNLTKVLQGGLYKNEIVLAIISVSLSIISFVKIFTSVLDNMVKPLFAKLKRENNTEGLLDIYRFDTRMNSVISVPLYLFFMLNAKNFLYLFGESYIEYPLILTIMAGANMISDLTGPNGTMLAMTGKEKYELFNGFIYFGIYIIFVFCFSFDKIYGLCFALLFSQFGVNIAKFIEVWKLYKKCPLDLKTILTILLEIVFDLLIIFALKPIKNLFIWFPVGIFVGICLVLLNCFIINFYRKTDFKNLLSLNV